MRKQSPFRAFIAITLMGCVFLSACGGAPVTTATATPIPTCIPNTPNPYTAHSITSAVDLYNAYINNPGALEDYKKEALLRLTDNAAHWSSTRDLYRDESRMIRVTVTLLDPVLVQYVILNDFFYNIWQNNLKGVSNEPYTLPGKFNEALSKAMTDLQNRQETLFLVTITSPAYDQQAFGDRLLTVQVLFENVVMINAADLRVPSMHDDHNLGEVIEISRGPVSGVIGFPLAQRNSADCLSILDIWNTTVTLEVPSARVADQNFETVSWTVPYDPLLDEEFYHPGNILQHRPEEYGAVVLDRYGPLPGPPGPRWVTNAAELQLYWQEMGQFFWNVIITELHH